MLKRGAVIWLTGLSGAGKTTLARALAADLAGRGKENVICLDGDELRNRFSDSGFSRNARHLHVLRAAKLASEHEAQGNIVIVSLISPYRDARLDARRLVNRFIEVFVDAPLHECERRDPKGLYRLARLGQIPNFTGITDPYEPPDSPEIHVHTSHMRVAECIRLINEYLQAGI